MHLPNAIKMASRIAFRFVGGGSWRLAAYFSVVDIFTLYRWGKASEWLKREEGAAVEVQKYRIIFGSTVLRL